MKFSTFEAPCGRLLLGVHGNRLCLCDWITGERTEKTLRRLNRYAMAPTSGDDGELLDIAATQLHAYFSGSLREFDIPLLPLGTPFQLRVWQALLPIPYGEKGSYKDIASAIGLPRGVRAVACAIGANPLSIFIPCHRIVGADGSLTGYAGGLEAKSYLLRLERGMESQRALPFEAL